MTTNRICLGRFLHAVANLKLAYGSPEAQVTTAPLDLLGVKDRLAAWAHSQAVAA